MYNMKKTWRKWNNEEVKYLKENYGIKLSKEIAVDLNRTYKSVIKKSETLKITMSIKKKMEKFLKNHAQKKKFEEKPINYFIAGYVAGEGCFTKIRNKTGMYFRFAVVVSSLDQELILMCRKQIGVGNIKKYKKRKSHWKDNCGLYIQNQKEIYTNLIPFMDKFLLESHKKIQFKMWKKEFYDKYNL